MNDPTIELLANDLHRSNRAAATASALEGLIAFALAVGTLATVLFHGAW